MRMMGCRDHRFAFLFRFFSESLKVDLDFDFQPCSPVAFPNMQEARKEIREQPL